MNSERQFVEVGYYQVCKCTEQTPGDRFMSEKNTADGRIIAVLSDGLGSGVKANVLSTLTASMALRCVSNQVSLPKVGEIITRTLPICSRRKISYATFTIIEVTPTKDVTIIEYDNPPVLVFRQGDKLKLERTEIEFKNAFAQAGNSLHSKLYCSRFKAECGDRILVFSDGLPQSGMGSREYPLGFTNAKTEELAENIISIAPNIAAQHLARQMVTRGVQNDDNHPHDDISCGVICFRNPRKLLLVTGPPFKKESDKEMVAALKNFEGTQIVCGGTTANIVARELNKPITSFWNTGDKTLPPTSHIEGIDLVTEGILTLSRVEELLQAHTQFDESYENGALMIIEKFLNADEITFLIGTKINETHLSPSFPVELEIRRTLMRRIAHLLEKKFLKKVNLHYI